MSRQRSSRGRFGQRYATAEPTTVVVPVEPSSSTVTPASVLVPLAMTPRVTTVLKVSVTVAMPITASGQPTLILAGGSSGILTEAGDSLATEADDALILEQEGASTSTATVSLAMTPTVRTVMKVSVSTSLAMTPSANSANPSNPRAGFTQLQLGNNVGYERYFSPSFAFANRFYNAQYWIVSDSALVSFDVNSPTPGTVPYPAFNNDFYPSVTIPYTYNSNTYVIHTTLFASIDPVYKYPAGVYVIEWDGTATIRVRGDCPTTTNSSGRFTVTIVPSGGINIVVMASTAADPIRNLRVWLPGTEDQATPWYAGWTAGWAQHDIVRFMNSGEINETLNPVVSYATRVPATRGMQMTAQTGGLALEHMIRFCNDNGKNPWVCFPPRLNIAGCVAYAQKLDSDLDDALTFYLEDGNEYWNTVFWQHVYMRNIGTGAVVDPIDGLTHNLQLVGNFPSPDPGAAAWAVIKYQARRTASIFDAIRTALGAPEPATPRYVRVAGVQSASGSGTAARVLLESLEDTDINPLGGDASDYIDAIAIAPYWGQATKALIAANTSTPIATLVTQVQADATNDTALWTSNNVARCTPYGVRVVAYEGGFDGGGNATTQARLSEIRQHADLETAYLNFRTAWYANGGKECVLLGLFDKADADGAWGQMEHQLATPFTQFPTHRAVVSWRAYLDSL